MSKTTTTDPQTPTTPPDFESELRDLLNRESMENRSDTPDYILAKYMMACLQAFNEATMAREQWYGRTPETPTTAGE